MQESCFKYSEQCKNCLYAMQELYVWDVASNAKINGIFQKLYAMQELIAYFRCCI